MRKKSESEEEYQAKCSVAADADQCGGQKGAYGDDGIWKLITPCQAVRGACCSPAHVGITSRRIKEEGVRREKSAVMRGFVMSKGKQKVSLIFCYLGIIICGIVIIVYKRKCVPS